MTTARVRLHESLPFGPGGRLQLPWPMTGPEATRWVGLVLAVLVVSTAAVAWVVVAVTEPSLWRVVVPLVWLLVFRFAVLPGLVGVLRPADSGARWDAFAAASLDER